MGTDDTTLIGKVEPSSFVAVGDRLLVHLNSSYGTACPGDTRTATKKSIVAVERGTTFQQSMMSKPALMSEFSGFGE